MNVSMWYMLGLHCLNDFNNYESTFFRGGNGGSAMLGNLPRITQPGWGLFDPRAFMALPEEGDCQCGTGASHS